MNKFESLNDELFHKMESGEMANVKGGAILWHTWLTGRTKHTSSTTGITYSDRMEYDEDLSEKVEVINFADRR